MPSSVHSIFKNSFEFLTVEDIGKVPMKTRGIYVLYVISGKEKNVVYVGMARGENAGMRGRLRRHEKDAKKAGLWTHFSVFEVWDNISSQQVEDLEGMFRHIFRYHGGANLLATQLSHKPLDKIRRKSVTEWGK